MGKEIILEIPSLTLNPAVCKEAVTEAAKARVTNFTQKLTGMEAMAPPGPEPPPIPPTKVETGEEGATLEPIAPTQNPDFSPEIPEGNPFDLLKKSDPIADITKTPALQAMASLGLIQVPTEIQPDPAVQPETKEPESAIQTSEQGIMASPNIAQSIYGSREAAAAQTPPPTRQELFEGQKDVCGSKPRPELKKDLKPMPKPSEQVQFEPPSKNVDKTAEPKPAEPAIESIKVEKVDIKFDPTPKPAEPVPTTFEGTKTDPNSMSAGSVADAKKLDPTPMPGLPVGDAKKIDPAPKPAEEAMPNGDGRVPKTQANPAGNSDAFSSKEDQSSNKKGFAPKPVPAIEGSDKSLSATPKPADPTTPVVSSDPNPKFDQVHGSKSVELTSKQSDSVVRQVIDRIESLALKSPNQKVTIHLDPKEFGSITMVVKQSGREVEAQVYASNGNVRRAIENGQKSLQTGLEQRGIQLGSMTVGSELPRSFTAQDQSAPKTFAQTQTFAPNAPKQGGPTLSLDAMRAFSRKSTGVDLWI